MKTIQAYPLQWPAGWKRTVESMRRPGHFGTTKQQRNSSGQSLYRFREVITVAQAIARIREELARIGVTDDDIVISTNLALRLDGFPRSGQPEPTDPGAALYWRDRGDTRCMAIDRYTKVAANLAAIAATLEAMRAIERHGGAEILDRAFTGFAALPAPGGSEHWRDVLGIADQGSRSEQLDRAHSAYRFLAAIRHPDKGGDADQMAHLNAAWAQAKKELQA